QIQTYDKLNNRTIFKKTFACIGGSVKPINSNDNNNNELSVYKNNSINIVCNNTKYLQISNHKDNKDNNDNTTTNNCIKLKNINYYNNKLSRVILPPINGLSPLTTNTIKNSNNNNNPSNNKLNHENHINIKLETNEEIIHNENHRDQ